MDKEKIIKAGKIAAEAKIFARSLVKPGVSLLEIANKIEAKIIELGGKPAFPCILSINEIAAHYTPSYDDETKASGLLKVDLGVHVDGWIADTAFSLDLEGLEENKNGKKKRKGTFKKTNDELSEEILKEIYKQLHGNVAHNGNNTDKL